MTKIVEKDTLKEEQKKIADTQSHSPMLPLPNKFGRQMTAPNKDKPIDRQVSPT